MPLFNFKYFNSYKLCLNLNEYFNFDNKRIYLTTFYKKRAL